MSFSRHPHGWNDVAQQALLAEATDAVERLKLNAAGKTVLKAIIERCQDLRWTRDGDYALLDGGWFSQEEIGRLANMSRQYVARELRKMKMLDVGGLPLARVLSGAAPGRSTSWSIVIPLTPQPRREAGHIDSRHPETPASVSHDPS